MNCAGAWQPGEPSGRPGQWSWRGTWRPLGPSSESSVLSSRTAAGSGLGPSVNSASRTSGSASSWPRWDDPDPGALGEEGADTRSWWGWACWSRPDGPDPHPHPQASQTEQELQRELDSLQGQCQAQALAGAELRTRLESLQGEVSAGWGRGSVEWGRLAWGLSGHSLALHS